MLLLSSTGKVCAIRTLPVQLCQCDCAVEIVLVKLKCCQCDMYCMWNAEGKDIGSSKISLY